MAKACHWDVVLCMGMKSDRLMCTASGDCGTAPKGGFVSTQLICRSTFGWPWALDDRALLFSFEGDQKRFLGLLATKGRVCNSDLCESGG